jgi:ElaB/YqjD/DUF883 family membrane-anchored ribosome-binding protein
MADRAYSSSDVPRYDTYPASPFRGPETPPGTPGENYQLPQEPERPGSAALNRRAEQIGSALGKTVSQVKRTARSAGDVRDRVVDISRRAGHQPGEPGLMDRAKDAASQAQQRVNDLAEQASNRAGELKENISGRIEEMSNDIQPRIEQARRDARMKFYEVRGRGRRLIFEHPVETVLATGALGFILGALLRVGREAARDQSK